MKWIRTVLAGGLALMPWTSSAFQDVLGHGPPRKSQITDPSPARFSVCFQHSCAEIDHTSLDEDQWERVRDLFAPPPASAEEERHRIAAAIAYLEVEIGKQINSLDDRGGNFEGVLATGNQLDCVDESTNSTTYLTMMERDRLLRFHRVEPRATRARNSFFVIGWPHSTAVVTDVTNGEQWAVDSWFLNNGEPPAIVPLPQWRSGWEPGA